MAIPTESKKYFHVLCAIVALSICSGSEARSEIKHFRYCVLITHVLASNIIVTHAERRAFSQFTKNNCKQRMSSLFLQIKSVCNSCEKRLIRSFSEDDVTPAILDLFINNNKPFYYVIIPRQDIRVAITAPSLDYASEACFMMSQFYQQAVDPEAACIQPN